MSCISHNNVTDTDTTMHGQTLKEPSVHCFNKHNIYITLYRNRFVAQMGEECRTVGTHPRSLDLQILHFLYSRQ